MSYRLSNEANLRPATTALGHELSSICLRTGDAGNDASKKYALTELLGDIYVIPYLIFEPEFSFALEFNGEISGYVLGALDTEKFQKQVAEKYWTQLREKYAIDDSHLTPADRKLLNRIMAPLVMDTGITKNFPSHLHIDLLETAQGRGLGRKMVEKMLEALSNAGSTGIHLTVAQSNFRAISFYKSLGFSKISVIEEEDVMACEITSLL